MKLILWVLVEQGRQKSVAHSTLVPRKKNAFFGQVKTGRVFQITLPVVLLLEIQIHPDSCITRNAGCTESKNIPIVFIQQIFDSAK